MASSTSFLSRFQALPQQPFDDNIFDNNDEEATPEDELLRDEETFGAPALAVINTHNNMRTIAGKKLVYTREFLMSLRDAPLSRKPMPNIPVDIQIQDVDQDKELEDDDDSYHGRRRGRANSRGGLAHSPNSRFSVRSSGLASSMGSKKSSTAAWFNEKVKPQDNLFFDSSNMGLTSDEINRKKAFEEFRKTHSFKAEQSAAAAASASNNNNSNAEILTEDELLAQQNVSKPASNNGNTASEKVYNIENMVLSKLNNNNSVLSTSAPTSTISKPAAKPQAEQQQQASGGRFQKYFKQEKSDQEPAPRAMPSVVAFDSSAAPVFSIPTPKLDEEEQEENNSILNKFKQQQGSAPYFDTIDDKLQPASMLQGNNNRSILDLVQTMKTSTSSNNNAADNGKNTFKDASSLEEELLKTLKTPSSSIPMNTVLSSQQQQQHAPPNVMTMLLNNQHNVHQQQQQHALHHHHHQHNPAFAPQHVQHLPFQPPVQPQQIPVGDAQQHQFDMNAFFSRYNNPAASSASAAPFMDASSIEIQLLHTGYDNSSMPFHHQQHQHLHHLHHQQLLPPNQYPVIPQQQAYPSASPVNQYQQYLYQQQLRTQQQQQQAPQPSPLVMNNQQPAPPILSEQNFPPLSGAKPASNTAANKQTKPARLIPTQFIKNQGKTPTKKV